MDQENRYTLEIQGTLFYFDPERQYVDFMGNVCEYSAAFHYRIYSRSILESLIGQLRTVKRDYGRKPTKTRNKMDTIDKVRIIESDAAPKEDAAIEEVMATIFHTDGSRER